MLLQAATTQSKVVEIISAIGNTWPLLLTIASISFFIIYRKEMGVFLTSFNKISGKTPIGEVSFEKKTFEIQTEDSNIQKTEIVSSRIASITDIDVIEETNHFSFTEITEELKNRNFESAQDIFVKMQEKERNQSEKEKNVLLMLLYKYIYAGVNTIDELKLNTQRDSVSREIQFTGYNYLAQCYTSGENFEEALNSYNTAYKLSRDEIEKAKTAKNISVCLCELGRIDEAIGYLKGLLNVLIENKSKLSIYRSLADVYDKTNNWVLKSLALEMSLSLEPNNTDLMFSAGYSYSNKYKGSEVISSLSLLHYQDNIKYNHKSYGALNNLGVAYGIFGLKGLATEKFKNAEELNNTLAASNLANKYIAAGFYNEARDILSRAKERSDIHENVWKSLEALSKSEKEEKEKLEKLIKTARDEQKFLKKFGESYFKTDDVDIDFTGEWLNLNEPVEVLFDSAAVSYDLSWMTFENKFFVKLSIAKCLAIIGSGHSSLKTGGFSENLLVFGLLSPDCKKMEILVFTMKYSKKSYIFEFRKGDK